MSFLKDFFLLNFNQYENFGFAFPIGIFCFSLAVAFSVAAFVINWHKSYTTALIKQLLRHEAIGEENAKTLAALRVDKIFGIKSALSRRGQLTYIVKRAGKVAPTYEEYRAASKKRGFREEKIDFDTALFYIDEGKLDRAKRLVAGPGAEWWRPALITVFLFAAFVLCAAFLPGFFEYINTTAGK